MAKKKLFPVAPSAANAVGPLTQPTGPDQWNVGLRDPQTLLDRLRQRGGLQPATLGGPAPMSPETVAGVQGIIGASPARQDRLAMAARAPATRFVDGEGFTPLGRPAYGSGARNLQTSRVGAGTMSNGMTGGGAIGSALMMSGEAVPGMAMGGVPQQPRQPAVDPYATAQATKVRMMQSGQLAPTVMRTQDGNTRVIGSGGVMLKPNEEQLANRSAFAAALDARRGNVASRQMAKGQARDERLQFSKDRQQYGQQGALVQAFQRQGVDPMRAMAMVAAMGGDKTAVNYLSEDNRQTRAAGEFSGRTELEKERNAIERDRLTAEIEQGKNAIDPGVVALQQAGQAAYQQAIADGQTEQEAESAAMQASMGKWQRFGTQPMVQPGQAPPGDTPISRLGDQYEAATGLPQWTGPAYGWMPLVPQGLSKVFGSEKRKRDAAKRISQYGKQ